MSYQNYNCLVHNSGLSKETLIFHLESSLLKSSSLFSHFMLVAFEAGGIFRAFIFLLFYPLICMFDEEKSTQIMVFLCFFGIKKENFRIGTSVLPKLLLEDIGEEGFDFIMKYGRKIVVSDMPKIMVDGFLKDYLGFHEIIGRELEEIDGYFTGFMEPKLNSIKLLKKMKIGYNQAIGFGCFLKFQDQLFKQFKDFYHVSKEEKKEWKILPRKRYPNPLIFHDGRLAFNPTPKATLAMFIWIPFGIFLFLIRFLAFRFLPLNVSTLILALTGVRNIISKPKSQEKNTTKKGTLFACNHKTLIDPLAISLNYKKPCLAAVTYSLSKFSEMISPIKTVSLTRNRDEDKKIMETMLSKIDLVVCPEGTTCREPYLLRFSPLFTEVNAEIVPVAVNLQVSMFYGSTASGYKWLDSVYHLMNPYPFYHVKILEKLKCNELGKKSSIQIANHVQNVIGNALGFQCTNFTRKDKYMILAGNTGII